MEGLSALAPGSPLARALQRGRDRYNARVTFARRQGRRFDPRAFAAHLADAVAPAVAAVEAAAPARTEAVAEALFDLSLDLVGREVLGPAARHPGVPAAWRELLPRLAPRLAEEPQRVAASITNAAWNLALEPGARAAEWAEGLAQLSPRCASVDELLAGGQVLAWRAGLAHLREAALATWERLPDALAGELVGLPPQDRAPRSALRALLADPWRRPGAPPAPAALKLVATVGGFRGFGGPFLTPPSAWAARGRLWVRDAERAWSVHADCFGQTLQRAADPPPAEPPGPHARLEADGTLSHRGLTARFDALAGASGLATLPSVVAATLPRSHRLLLFARTGGAA